MPIKRHIVILSIFIVFIIVAISLFSLWPLQHSQTNKYDIIVDDVVNGYARSPVILHATIKSDMSSGSPGWDINNDSVIDVKAILIDPAITYDPLDYRAYQPWKSNITKNEERWYAYTQFNQSGNYSLVFLLRGVDGLHKKEMNVNIVEPKINLTMTPIKTPFNSGDDIEFHAMVKNEGPFSIWIEDPSIFPESVHAQITIPNGTIVEEYISEHSQQRVSTFRRLEAEQTYTIDNGYDFNFTSKAVLFGNSAKGIYEYKFNDIGIYKIKLEYYFGISGLCGIGKSDSSFFYTEFQVIR